MAALVAFVRPWMAAVCIAMSAEVIGGGGAGGTRGCGNGFERALTLLYFSSFGARTFFLRFFSMLFFLRGFFFLSAIIIMSAAVKGGFCCLAPLLFSCVHLH